MGPHAPEVRPSPIVPATSAIVPAGAATSTAPTVFSTIAGTRTPALPHRSATRPAPSAPATRAIQ
jgi:hypothetical protein